MVYNLDHASPLNYDVKPRSRPPSPLGTSSLIRLLPNHSPSLPRQVRLPPQTRPTQG